MEISVTDVGKFKVIKPLGRVDWESARLLDMEIQRQVDANCCDIVFNLDEVTFICSGGVGALVYNLNKVTKMGGAIYIIADNEYINYIFQTLKFDMIFSGFMYKTFEEFADAVLHRGVEG